MPFTSGDDRLLVHLFRYLQTRKYLHFLLYKINKKNAKTDLICTHRFH